MLVSLSIGVLQKADGSTLVHALQEKDGYPKLSGLEKLGINSQKLPLNPV